MIIFLLILIIFLAVSPILFSFHRKVKHKKLLFFTVILLNLQPLGTIIVPAFFAPDLFNGAMFNYLLIALIYYLLVFLFYWISISFIPTNIPTNIQFLTKRNKITIIVFLSAIFFFSILVAHSNGIFLTNPRLGYQAYREGFGVIWVLYILSVSILFYFIAIKREINLKKVLFFALLMFFTGSKGLILQVFLKSFLVYIWIGKRIKKRYVLLMALVLVALMLKLFGQFGAEKDFSSRANTYFDYMNQANKVFQEYEAGQLEHTYGSISLGVFWTYVPRAIYPNKPFVYGYTSLVGKYYPGLAERGHTPSFGRFTHEFVDFGWFAPLFTLILSPGIMIGILSLVVLITNANVSRRWRVGSMLFILAPGFGFHFPIIFTFFVAFILVPSLTKISK
jgi:hypothetical protein